MAKNASGPTSRPKTAAIAKLKMTRTITDVNGWEYQRNASVQRFSRRRSEDIGWLPFGREDLGRYIFGCDRIVRIGPRILV